MKQKIVIEVHMDSEKCRGKAMKIAAVAQGVSSVSIEGNDKDQVVVVGDEVDSVCLAKTLRKKFRHAKIVSVQEVKEGDAKTEPKKEIINIIDPQLYCYNYCPPPINPVCYGKVVCDPNPPDCSIMSFIFTIITVTHY
ncbi:Heavy metal-associated domain containing protein [Quillaja saponaria]|uniref:Heavy metal-associated domain containing protein n=1 Tax=Quillaja saponaria TaxID=32244 RepID=A0AAD7LSH9_QUISA|nr:Heavy metal-associated domain containing protein [Quillaja saponaria]